MKITKIEVWNFRLLKKFSISLEDDLSVVIGKNNTGKTSLLAVLNRFLGRKRAFAYDDISIGCRSEVGNLLRKDEAYADDELLLSIGMRINIQYADADDLSAVAKLITNLDPEDNRIILDFAYELTGEKLRKLTTKWKASGQKGRANRDSFLRQNLIDVLGKPRRRSKSNVKDGNDIDLDSEKISLEDVICFKAVSANRDVTNKDNDKTLSGQTAKLYTSLAEGSSSDVIVESFKKTLRNADTSFSKEYEKIFENLISKVKKFGGLRDGESKITIASTLQHRDILTSNATVMYEEAKHELPEHYNGLGYMNLISMIFEIDILMKEFLSASSGNAAKINLLFIEEPEAHTHPQMQYVFIKNIRELLKEAGEGLSSLQTVLSTHSAHIVAEAEFDAVKYLQRSGSNVDAKSLRDLENDLRGNDEEKRNFRFLRQYLTLHRSELFFADKIVLIEGDTERILLPAMMKKIDQDGVPPKVPPLLSQNISIVEVGAYSHIYAKFLLFLGIKTLVVTDIDSGYLKTVQKDSETKEEYQKCCPNDENAKFTSNHSLCFYHGKNREELPYFLTLNTKQKTCDCTQDNHWSSKENGRVFIAFQTEEVGYHARSFEDAFFSLNRDFLAIGYGKFPSLVKKWYDKYMNGEATPFNLAENGVTSKPSFAIEVLLNSAESDDGKLYNNWKTPAYIEEGLKWLRGDFDA